MMTQSGSPSCWSRAGRGARAVAHAYDPSAQTLSQRLEPPSRSHPMGLDELGRDILARLVAGARISLFVGLAVVSVSSLIGMALGSIAGYFGGAGGRRDQPGDRHPDGVPGDPARDRARRGASGRA
jgi:ABC-type dipeptide/oligopeptide/nickel transport system permease subunit